MKTTAVALIALVAFACVASVAQAQPKKPAGPATLTYCRKSAFAMPCSQLRSAKVGWWAACGKAPAGGIVPAGDFKTEGACCTITQRVASAADWEKYRQCEHATPLYINSFKAKAPACSKVAAAGACATILG